MPIPRSLVLIALAAACGLAALMPGSARTPEPAKDAVRLIPLSSMHYTAVQNGTNLFRQRDIPEGRRDYVAEMFRNARHVGASNVLLVSGADVNQAIRSTAEAYVSGWGGRSLLSVTGQAAGGRVWVAAFLGAGSSTPAKWEIKRVEVAGRVVRVVYGQVRRLFVSCDI